MLFIMEYPLFTVILLWLLSPIMRTAKLKIVILKKDISTKILNIYFSDLSHFSINLN